MVLYFKKDSKKIFDCHRDDKSKVASWAKVQFPGRSINLNLLGSSPGVANIFFFSQKQTTIFPLPPTFCTPTFHFLAVKNFLEVFFKIKDHIWNSYFQIYFFPGWQYKHGFVISIYGALF